MKYNTLKISFLLLVAIFTATIGFSNLPIWAYILIESVSIILLVYVSVRMFRVNNRVFDQKLNKLTETISLFSEQSKAQLENNTSKLLDSLSNNQEQILQELTHSEEALSKNIEKSTSQIHETLSHTCDLVQKEFSKQTELVGTLQQETTELFDGLSKDILSWNESSRKHAIENTNELKRTLASNTEHLYAVVNDSLKAIQESTLSSSDQLKKLMEQLCNTIQESIATSATDLATKTDALNETLKTTNDEIQVKVESASNGMSKLITEGIGTITTSVLTGIDVARQASSESAELIMSANKENSASILQKVEDVMQHSITIQESITTSATDLAVKTDALNETLKTTNDEIQAKVEGASNSMSQLITEGIGAITTSVSTGIDGARQASSESAELIMSANKENSASILQKVEDVMQHSITIQESITTSATDLAVKTDALNETLKTTNDEIQAKVESASNGMSQLISEGIGAITTSVSTGIDGARQASSESAEQIMSANKENSASILQKVEDVMQHSIAIQESITTSATDLAAKTDTLNETIKTTNDEIQAKVESASNGMSKLITEGIGTITTSVSTGIDGARQASSESAELIMSANKENSASILQKVEDVMQHSITIQESITTSASDLAVKTDALTETLKTTNDEIQAKVESTSTGMTQIISEGFGAITTAVSTGIDAARLATSESAEQIMSANKENNEAVLQKVDGIMQQSIAIHDSINTSATDLATKTDAMNETIKTTNDEIQAKVENASNSMSQLISEGIGVITTSVSTGIDGAKQASSESAEQIMSANKENSATILQKVDELILQGATIEKQNNTISSLIVDSVKESDKATEMFMSGLQDQYQTINKRLTSVQLKTENIENSVLHISEKEFNKKIADSIQSLILELRTDIKNSISDINNEFLDTQIAQGTINSELEKLQVLLRTVISSFENKTEKIVKQVATESNKQVKPSSSTPSILHNVSRSVEQNVKSHQPDPNRTESIVDSETKNIVVNQYKDGNVVKSTMKDSKGHTIYEVEYSKGKIVRTRNYDSKGKLTIEQTFYDNGQVHYRNEYTSKGQTTTEFDINGKKK